MSTPTPRDKRMTLDEIVAELRSGMTIGIGGWGSRRKPMALVRAILRSDLTDLTVVTYGGPELGLLCSAGKVKRAYYGFVSLDSAPFYDPWFARRRLEGSIEVREMDEGMVRSGLTAAAHRLPFLPTRAGLGSDVFTFWGDELKTIDSPYPVEGKTETLVAMPALRLDAALIHLDKSDKHGNAAYTGADGYFDDLYAMAADKVYLETDEIVESADALMNEVGTQRMLISRMFVDGVAEAPNGAHFTFAGGYGRDEAFQRHYATAAKDDESWSAFVDEFLSGSEEDYQKAVKAFGEKIAAEKAAEKGAK